MSPIEPVEPLSPVKQELLAALQARLPAEPTLGLSQTDSELQDIEDRLLSIWQRVLGKQDIARHDNYFRLGGDSTRSIQIVAQARMVGLSLTTRALYDNPTVALLARGIRAKAVQPVTAVQPATAVQPVRTVMSAEGSSDSYPLTPAQAGLLYENLTAPERGLYQSGMVLDVIGELNVDLLCLAWNRLITSEAVLRTRFEWTQPGAPHQWVEPAASSHMASIQAHTICDESVAELIRDLRKQIRRLDCAPLYRLALVRVNPTHHLLIFVHHHLILDGWSQALLLQRLFADYGAFAAGREPDAIERVPFRRFVEQVCLPRSVPSGFWRTYLKGHDFEPRLVCSSGSPHTELRSFRIPSDIALRLEQLAADISVTFSTLFQGVWTLAVAAVAGTREIVYGLVVSGRDASVEHGEDLTGVIGMCANTLPVRVKVSGGETLAHWLREVGANVLELVSHQYASLSAIKRQVAGAACQSLFETLVVIENLPRFPPDGRLQVSLRSFEIEEGWPLVVVLHPGASPLVQLRAQAARCQSGVPEALEHLLDIALRQLATVSPDTDVAAVQALLSERGPMAAPGSLTAARRDAL